MATVIPFSGPSQVDLENLVTIGNRIAETQELYDRVAAGVLDQIIKAGCGVAYEAGHRAQFQVKHGLDGTRQEHLILDGQRVFTRIVGSKSKLKKRRRFP